jgi:hypothetical protein
MIAMADAGVLILEDATAVEKRGRGRPRGSKNKPKASTVDASSSTPAKHRRGCPLGNKNKVKTSATLTSAGELLDVSLAQLVLPQSSSGIFFPFLLSLMPNAVSNIAFL